MRVPTYILDVIKPILLEQKETVHCKFTSNNGEIHMITTNKNLKTQNYLIARYENEQKSCKLTRSLNRIYKF